MNTQFTDEQLKAYASHFREGDAIWSNGKWCEVVEYGRFYNIAPNDKDTLNSFIVNWGGDSDFEGCASGFSNDKVGSYRYRVTTIKDYELKGGEKIVWLGKSGDILTFGKVYEVDSDGRYRDDTGDLLIAKSSLWGVIPRYEQVKNIEKSNVSDEEFDEFLNTLDKVLEPVKPDNQLEHVVHYPTAADREEEVLKLKTFELFTSENTSEEIIRELKEIAVIGINKGDYEEAIKAIELIKEWEENSK